MSTSVATNGRALTTTPRWVRPVVAVETLPPSMSPTGWLVALERNFALVPAALQSLRREKLALRLGESLTGTLTEWAQQLAHEIEHGDVPGVIVLTTDPGLVCCVANKVEPIRAVAISTLAQAAQATLSLQPNFVALEMPGRTYYEIRQVLYVFGTTQPRLEVSTKRGCTCASAK